jgi:hypothetical protein
MLSRMPVLSHTAIPVPPVHGEVMREIVRSEVLIGKDTLSLFVCHWPSKYHRAGFRLHAARRVREAVEQLPPGRRYLIVGDLNVNYDAPLRAMTADSVREACREASLFTRVFPIVHEMRCGAFPRYMTIEDMRDTTGYVFYSPWPEMSPARRFSYMYRDMLQTLDHFLLPPSLFRPSGWCYEPGSFHRVTRCGLLIMQGRPYRWQRRYTPAGMVHAGYGYSDHLPLMLTLVEREGTGTESGDRSHAPWAVSPSGPTPLWQCGHPGTVITQDTMRPGPADGPTYMVTSEDVSENRCACRIFIPVSSVRFGNGEASTLRFFVRGRAKAYWRVRTGTGRDWTYYLRAHYTPATYPRYFPYNYDRWHPVSLRLPEPCRIDETLILELHTYAHTPLQLWICGFFGVGP